MIPKTPQFSARIDRVPARCSRAYAVRSAAISLLVVLGCNASGVVPGSTEIRPGTGALAGTLADDDGGRIVGVTLALDRGPHTVAIVTTETDAHGEWSFGAVPPGAYDVVLVEPARGYAGRFTARVIDGQLTRMRAIATGGPTPPHLAEADAFRGARLWDDLRYENSDGGEGTLPATLRCAECHGYQAERPVPPRGFRLADVLAERSARQLAAAIGSHPVGSPERPLREVLAARFEPDRQVADLAAFLRTVWRRVDSTGGSLDAGRATFTAICARCHGADGRSINLHGATSGATPEYLGEANEEPDEFVHRIQYGHPQRATEQHAVWGLQMPAFRGFSPQVIRDVMAFLRTLPEY